MSDSQGSMDRSALDSTILKWISSRLEQDQYEKIQSFYSILKKDAEDWEVFSSFSAVPRYTGKDSLNLSTNELHQAENIRSGWNPAHWSLDELGRTLMVSALANRTKESFFDKLDKLFVSSDMGEAKALYQSLPLLPYPEDLTDRAAEGVRSNITSVFNAVALRNPYPADYMDSDAWNQIVLKSLFVESPLYLIYGIDKRVNKNLAHMLVEFAHERWSAGREVPPELWRPVGPFIDQNYIEDIQKVLSHDNEIHRQAAVLALSDSNAPAAKKVLKEHEDVLNTVQEKGITWNTIGELLHDTAD